MIEGLSKPRNVLVNPTGVDLFAPPSQSASPTSKDFDIGVQTLEGYILPLLLQARSSRMLS